MLLDLLGSTNDLTVDLLYLAEASKEEEEEAKPQGTMSQVLIGHLASYEARSRCRLAWLASVGCMPHISNRCLLGLVLGWLGSCATASDMLLHGTPLSGLQGMGKAEVECISGCRCDASVLDGWWERHASLQVMHTVLVRVAPWAGGGQGSVFFRSSVSEWSHCEVCLLDSSMQVTEHAKCRIKLTVLEASSGKGKAAGHKVKLTAALVLAGTSTEGLTKPGR